MPRFLRAPAGLGERISGFVDALLFRLPGPSKEAGATANATAAANGTHHTHAEQVIDAAALRALDSDAIRPFQFFGSGYGLMLIVTAILLNRIHNIVRRPRAPPPIRGNGMRARIGRALTSPRAPHWLRVPGICALGIAWSLFTVITLQTGGLWPSPEAVSGARMLPSYVRPYLASAADALGAWADRKEMEDVCWTVFLCVCTGLVCGALANGLDSGHRRDVGTSFNLFGFSFLLHFYASPLTHTVHPEHHGRPDVNVLFQLWVGLTELTWLQALELSPSLRRNQLLPTGVCGALGLTHFVYTLVTAPLRFPSFTFLTHLLALLLTIVVSCTVLLRAFTHIFTLGYIPTPILANLLPNEGAIPSAEDDVGVALLKLGTACIEATSYSGLRNEVAAVEEVQPWIELSSLGSGVTQPKAPNGFGVRIDDIRVAELRNPNDDSPRVEQAKKFWRACGNLAKDVFWTTMLGTPVGRRVYRYLWVLYNMRWWYGPRQWRVWRRSAWAAPPRYIDPLPPALMTSASTGWSSAVQLRRDATPVIVGANTPEVEFTYDQVLRGEVVLENEDDDDDWRSEASDTSVATMAVDEDEDDEQATLYRDLVVREATPEGDDSAPLQPILLAHLTSSSSSPLTRRRYAAMLGGPASSPPSTPTRGVSTSVAWGSAPDATLADVVVTRRAVVAAQPQPDMWDEERRHSCVVCMVQTRDVILWPCRCLLMCNDCRESLAARLAAKDHVCPNCRTKVEGYSRIYVP